MLPLGAPLLLLYVTNYTADVFGAFNLSVLTSQIVLVQAKKTVCI